MLSVVIPVYNGERCIRRAIEGVLAQTYTNWELILVDDGSTDGTAAICDEYASARIRVIHQPNGGVSAARNAGIAAADGEYLAFVDADDIIERDYLANLAQGIGHDLIITGYCYGDEPYESTIECTSYDEAKLRGSLSRLLNTDHFCFPWARLFRRSIIEEHHLRFDTRLRFAEDHVFNWSYLCHARSLYVDAHPCYHKMPENDKPYNLTFEEMELVDQSLFQLKNELETSFHTKLNIHPERVFHVLFLKDPIKNYRASALLDYYKKYHPTDTEAQGYDQIARTVYHRALVTTARTAQTDAGLAVQNLRELHHFIDKPWRMFARSTIKTRWLILLISAGVYRTTLFVLKKLFR